MPGFVVDGVNEDGLEVNVTASKENSVQNMRSPKSTLSPQSPRSVDEEEGPLDGTVDTSIEQLYDNVCDMQSSDQSPSRQSYLSEDDNESRIDSELRHLVGGGMREVEIMEEEVAEEEIRGDSDNREDGSSGENCVLEEKTRSSSNKSLSLGNSNKGSSLQVELDECTKSSPEQKNEKQNGKILKKKATPPKKQRNFPLAGGDTALDNPDLGPFLLKQARDLISSGDNLRKALDFALRASKSFEICADGKPILELVMSLHVVAAVHCSLGQYNEAIPILQRSIEIPSIEDGHDHALAKFAGNMQLGDTFAMLGQLENSIGCYTNGLEIQKQVLGEKDPRVGETCRYLAEAHVQAMQFDEAEKLCQLALDIHRESGSPASLEEAADRRLMGLICGTKGDHEKALEHLILASMAMVANGQEKEVASVDCSIGDTYLSLCRYDEAIFAYEKALTSFKATKGENHPAIASVYVCLADLYIKTGKLRESKSYCENALRIYSKPVPGILQEEIASGFTDVSAIYESMNELDQALKLLQKALKIYGDAPGQQNTVAGIEAQMGVMYYMLGKYTESYSSLKSAVTKLRASGEKKSALFGIALNQMGLTCVQRYAINEAAELFEEAKIILEQEYGPCHPDTLGVYSNLAGTYDAIGRLDEAIELLEYVVGMREDKLGTANPDVDDEKRRLAELLKEAGKVRSRKARSLETLLDANSHHINDNGIKV
ncbi:protein KINESIN LIGHT CHAIN-RELATED 3-like [Amaranthus tricolor]|uniref:protein KINESIN LIGHT CHAIN-RELATED 3-like n=1 Tax=Amaranthus tricolor TaxID=29722 RepID=UPI00258695CA|nr:protein KINESIN LIGHT CHAIN-RELATED 3-like [Amaranthus tricolor]